MISLATAATIFFSGVAGGSATILTEDAISKHNSNPERVDKVSAKIIEKANKRVSKKHEKMLKKNPDLEISSEQIDEDCAAEVNKLVKRNAMKEVATETVIPSVVGGLITAGVVALCAAIADTAADDSDEDTDEDDSE